MFMYSGRRTDEDKLDQLRIEERDIHEKIRNLRAALERDLEKAEQRYGSEIKRYEQKVTRLGEEIKQLEREVARNKK